MGIPDKALEAAAEALGLDLDDNVVARVYAHDGTLAAWGVHVGEMLVAAIEAAAPHLTESGDNA